MAEVYVDTQSVRRFLLDRGFAGPYAGGENEEWGRGRGGGALFSAVVELARLE